MTVNISLEQVFEQSYKKAYRAAKAVCFDAQGAEDAVSEALVRLMGAMQKRRIDNAEAYFVRIAINEAKRIRAKQREIPIDDLNAYLNSITTQNEETYVYREAARELRKAVDSLGQKLALPIKLYYYGGFSELETADLLGISYSAVKTRLFRARQKLKVLLTPEDSTIGGEYHEI
ncbi:RNA polymerase sigma factor [Christensenellaceae bacterium OttesenSCG-928-K19]|nr:RNA polymerase sigma factor [Christensenellaceae bacterium OttesenSCG-928-K19]